MHIQGRIQPVRLEGAISVIFGSQSDYGLDTVREMKHISPHCCDKTMDNEMALNR